MSARLRLTGARTTAGIALTTGLVLAGGALAAPAQAAPVQAGPVQAAPAAAKAPTVGAKGAYLLDNANGKSLFSKAGDTRRQMASTTKIMTVSVVLDTKGVDLNRKVTVKQAYRDYVAKMGASTADLRTGDKLTVRQLLYATMLPSGCDAAMALADTFGSGTTTAARTKSFISKMNAKAKELGLKNTAFDSFDGNSPKGKTYSSPKDLANLTRHALKKTDFRTVVKSTQTVQKAPAANGGTRTYTWYNTNKLLGSYKGTIGVKTGTNTPAGPCLVFAGTRGSKTVVGVLLNDSADRFKDAGKLMDHAFGTKTAKNMTLRKLPASAQRD
ncbi:D-alanyl-D-alanine carboxypeptidase family protein [Streptomyces physcomitrii]|uniref:D-alanyl-D-alanine carboxypeptidase family protein n=1 Tax=Streptomyces physcomitrii TaxID=2724184 RepID=UPI0028AD0662|nr:serine hydrolase [Streptomyces physcomitrii]